jgi:hypothetical protein
MVEMAEGGSFFDLEKTQRDMDKAYDKVERASTLNVAKESRAMATDLQQNLARYGGGAFDTGASKETMANVFSDMNVQIANMSNSFAIQRNQAKMSANMYFTDLASRGIIDPATGSFLKSTFNMQVELNEQQFRNQMAMLEKQGAMQENASMWGGLGTIAGMALFGPLGGMIGGQVGSKVK